MVLVVGNINTFNIDYISDIASIGGYAASIDHGDNNSITIDLGNPNKLDLDVSTMIGEYLLHGFTVKTID